MYTNKRENEVQPQVYQQYASIPDEITLVEYWKNIVDQKWLILGITAFCTVLAIGVTLLLPREYRAELIMMPPLVDTAEKLSVPGINVGSSSIEDAENSMSYFFKVETQDLYNELIENLQSRQLQYQFFKENKLVNALSSKEDNRAEEVIFEKEFSEKLTVKGIHKNKGAREFVTITLKGRHPKQIADWLNAFVQMADKKTLLAQTRLFSIKVKRVRDNVLQRIESLRSMEQSRRLDTIVQLEEALAVANKIGWDEAVGNSNFINGNATIDRINMSLNLQSPPLYWRGAKALQVEIDVLKRRGNDDPFISELRSLQEQLNFLLSVKQDADNVHVMRIDRPAIEDHRPIKPKRKLIVIFGFVLGVTLSVIVAYIRSMIVRENNLVIRGKTSP